MMRDSLKPWVACETAFLAAMFATDGWAQPSATGGYLVCLLAVLVMTGDWA